jgi:hypothetical protein
VAIFVEGRGRVPLALGVVYCVENYAPLSDVNRGVLEEVVEENLDNENVFISDAEKQREPTSLNSRPLLS